MSNVIYDRFQSPEAKPFSHFKASFVALLEDNLWDYNEEKNKYAGTPHWRAVHDTLESVHLELNRLQLPEMVGDIKLTTDDITFTITQKEGEYPSIHISIFLGEVTLQFMGFNWDSTLSREEYQKKRKIHQDKPPIEWPHKAAFTDYLIRTFQFRANMVNGGVDHHKGGVEYTSTVPKSGFLNVLNVRLTQNVDRG